MSFQPGTDQRVCSVEDRICTLTLNRPHARNVQAPDMSRALGDAIAWATTAATAGADVITRAGGDIKATAIARKADPLLKSRSTADHRKAVKAFAEIRASQFTGR